MFVLRHQRRLPAGAAPFVQQIGQRIFILARVSRKLYHHSLVFFHQPIKIIPYCLPTWGTEETND